MFHPPQTLEEAKAYKYGQWAGKPSGYPYNDAHCAYETMGPGGYLFHQCSRPNGHGPDGLYCKQHAKRVTR